MSWTTSDIPHTNEPTIEDNMTDYSQSDDFTESEMKQMLKDARIDDLCLYPDHRFITDGEELTVFDALVWALLGDTGVLHVSKQPEGEFWVYHPESCSWEGYTRRDIERILWAWDRKGLRYQVNVKGKMITKKAKVKPRNMLELLRRGYKSQKEGVGTATGERFHAPRFHVPYPDGTRSWSSSGRPCSGTSPWRTEKS